jgi:hypothetical protein
VTWSLPLFLLLTSSSELCALCPCVIVPGEDLSRPETLVPRARRDAETIFTGRVVAVDTLATGEQWFPSDTSAYRRLLHWAETVRYTFHVSEVWKGKHKGQLTVIVQQANSSCGRSFDADSTYLIYAERGARELEASSCARVRRLSDAAADLAVLGRGWKGD